MLLKLWSNIGHDLKKAMRNVLNTHLDFLSPDSGLFEGQRRLLPLWDPLNDHFAAAFVLVLEDVPESVWVDLLLYVREFVQK